MPIIMKSLTILSETQEQKNKFMPKEIAIKTKGETYYKCTHCGDEIFWNTHKKFIYPIRELDASNGASCKCKKIWVDGCEDFTPLDMKLSNGVNVRVGGKEEDRKVITK